MQQVGGPGSFCSFKADYREQNYSISSNCLTVAVYFPSSQIINLHFEGVSGAHCTLEVVGRGAAYPVSENCGSLTLTARAQGRVGLQLRAKLSSEKKQAILDSVSSSTTELPVVPDVHEKILYSGTSQNYCPKAEIDYLVLGEFWTVAFVSVCMLHFTARGINILVEMVRRA